MAAKKTKETRVIASRTVLFGEPTETDEEILKDLDRMDKEEAKLEKQEREAMKLDAEAANASGPAGNPIELDQEAIAQQVAALRAGKEGGIPA